MMLKNSILTKLLTAREKHLASLGNRALYSQYILLALLVLGTFFPTSIHGEISKLCSRSSQIILTILLLSLLYLNGVINRKAVWCSLAIYGVLVVATLLSPLPDFALGASIYLFPIPLIICLNLRDIGWCHFLSKGFLLVSIILILLSLSIVFDVGLVEKFFHNNYSRFYESLLGNMFFLHKPVIFFTSHSIAAFMFFWFFFICLNIFAKTRKYQYLVTALLFIYTMWMLKSNTSIILTSIALIVMASYAYRYDLLKKSKLYNLLLVLVLLVSIWNWSGEIVSFVKSVEVLVQQRMSSSVNGFFGRYSSTGVLQANIQYICKYPFSPIGLRNAEWLWLCDSGPVEYFLRGSIVLFVAIYYGLYNFINHNLYSKRLVWFLFLFIFFSELGFSFMTYFRFQYLFPFFITYIHHIEKGKVVDLGVVKK